MNRKNAWRRAYRSKSCAQRTLFSSSVSRQLGAAVALTENLTAFFDQQFPSAHHVSIGAYYPTPTEPDVLLFTQVARVRRWQVFFPFLEEGRDWSGTATDAPIGGPATQSVHAVPSPTRVRALWNRVGLRPWVTHSPPLDAVLVPGVAFGRSGERLGRGAGWYDRALRELPEKTVRVGVTFDSQIAPEGALPVDPWDERVGFLITPTAVHPQMDRR